MEAKEAASTFTVKLGCGCEFEVYERVASPDLGLELYRSRTISNCEGEEVAKMEREKLDPLPRYIEDLEEGYSQKGDKLGVMTLPDGSTSSNLGIDFRKAVEKLPLNPEPLDRKWEKVEIVMDCGCVREIGESEITNGTQLFPLTKTATCLHGKTDIGDVDVEAAESLISTLWAGDGLWIEARRQGWEEDRKEVHKAFAAAIFAMVYLWQPPFAKKGGEKGI